MIRCLISIKGSEARPGCMEIAHNTAQNDSELDSVLMTAHPMAGEHRETLVKAINFVSKIQQKQNKSNKDPDTKYPDKQLHRS